MISFLLSADDVAVNKILNLKLKLNCYLYIFYSDRIDVVFFLYM